MAFTIDMLKLKKSTSFKIRNKCILFMWYITMIKDFQMLCLVKQHLVNLIVKTNMKILPTHI